MWYRDSEKPKMNIWKKNTQTNGRRSDEEYTMNVFSFHPDTVANSQSTHALAMQNMFYRQYDHRGARTSCMWNGAEWNRIVKTNYVNGNRGLCHVIMRWKQCEINSDNNHCIKFMFKTMSDKKCFTSYWVELALVSNFKWCWLHAYSWVGCVIKTNGSSSNNKASK